MITWTDVYHVLAAMVPLYVALALGYASVKRWRMFDQQTCTSMNRLNCYFILPFFTFHFTAGINPYTMNFRFLLGDVVAKAIAEIVIGVWVFLQRRNGGDPSWAITSFSLSSLNNTLVVGVPLLSAMYGEVGENLVVQSSVIHSLVWYPILLFLLEIRATTKTHLGPTMKRVALKLAKNPNCIACVAGLIWALLANRWNFKMPTILEGSVMILARAGSGVIMFSMGLFMSLQERLIACGMRLTIYSMVLRFVGGPLAVAVVSLALGLRSNILHIAILQAALPQSVTTFVFAQEYELHPNVLNTAVIFGTIVSLPLLVAYYALLELIPH